MPRTPNTIIQFCNVPWDSGYRNLRYFGSKSARDAWFSSRSHVEYPTDMTELNITHAQPVKEGIPYTVASNWDNMHRYNYCRYKNNAYEQGEWQYCFIDGWQYASEHSCSFVFHRDAYINNIGHLTFSSCFIERETTDEVNDLPEPVSINHYVHPTTDRLGDWHGTMVYMMFHCFGGVESYSPPSCKIDGVTYPIGLLAGQSLEFIANMIANIVDVGRGGDIINVYAVPHEYCNVIDQSTIEFPQQSGKVERSHGSYTPKNKKCLRYPYCYYEVFDEFSGQQVFKWEDDGGEFNYRIDGGLGLSAYAMISPDSDYNLHQQSISHPILGNIGWSASGLQSWIAQNTDNIKAQNQQWLVGALQSMANTALGVAGGAIGGQFQDSYNSKGVMTSSGFAGGLTAATNVAGTVVGLAGSSASLDIAQNQAMANAAFTPNNCAPPNGATMGLMTQGKLGFWGRAVYPSRKEFEALDNFFTRFGYNVSRIGVPYKSPSGYYFVKTAGCTIKGASPQEDRNVLMQAFDRGITLWSTDAIGNYS